MGIDSGFNSFGFVDDREEEERWGLLDKKLSEANSPTPPAKEEDTIHTIDGKMEVGDDGTSDWVEDMQKSSLKTYKRKGAKNRNFFQRNKREIFDAVVILGIIYVGYKLFFEKDDEGDFDHGGEVDYTPTPQSVPAPEPAAPINPAPPRPEMPEATYSPEA